MKSLEEGTDASSKSQLLTMQERSLVTVGQPAKHRVLRESVFQNFVLTTSAGACVVDGEGVVYKSSSPTGKRSIEVHRREEGRAKGCWLWKVGIDRRGRTQHLLRTGGIGSGL